MSELGISEQTFYRWKRKFAGMGVTRLRRLKQLEEENRNLKQLVADLTLDKHMLQEVLRKRPEAGLEAGSSSEKALSVATSNYWLSTARGTTRRLRCSQL